VFGRPVDWVLRLCAAVGRDEHKLAAVSCRLKLSNDIRTRLERLATSRILVNADLSPEAQRAALYRAGPQLFRDLALLQWAEGRGDEHLPLRAVFIKSFSWTPPVFPLTGADVVAAGVPEGPEVGRILSRIEESWIAEDFKSDREALLKRISGQG
jgi:poly(A) polymerase